MATENPHPSPIMAQEDDLPGGSAPGKVTIGYLSGTEVCNDFMMSLLALKDCDRQAGWDRLDHKNWWINQRSGVNVSRPRNALVRKFLTMRDPAPEWLLMVDADMKFDPNALEQLMASAQFPDRLVIGGLCVAFGADTTDPSKIALMSTVFDMAEPAPGIDLPAFKVLPAKDVQRKALREVYGTGAAFLLIHRQVLIDIAVMVGQQYPWFREIVVPDTREDVDWGSRHDYWVSEDLFFCLQAHQAGHRVWVNTGTEIQHIKPIKLTENLWRSYGRVVQPA